MRYWNVPSVNIAKGRPFPRLQGWLIPSFDRQCSGGWAVNWLWIRMKLIRNWRANINPSRQFNESPR